MQLSILLVVAFVLAVATVSQAQKKIHNDYLSRFAELERRPAEVLEHFDVDKDGKVEQHEASKILDDIDTNNDGKATKAEMEKWSGQHKNIIDNQKGFLSAMSKIPGIVLTDNGSALKHDPSQLERCGTHKCASFNRAALEKNGFSKEVVTYMLDTFDLDKDGALEAHEMHALIDKIDVDDSGTVSPKELEAYFKQYKAHGVHAEPLKTMLSTIANMQHDEL